MNRLLDLGSKAFALVFLPLFLLAVPSAYASGHLNAQGCDRLSHIGAQALDPTAKIDRATWIASTSTEGGASVPGAGAKATVKDHCEVIGSLQRREGLNGQAYAIRFHLRLPSDWNGRFIFQGGGGSNGELGDALGHVSTGGSLAINEGYAVVSQDSGHDNATNTDPAHNGSVAFGFDPVARENYGHLSLKLVADAAKALIRTYYGKGPKYSYFFGCSKGGQEGMTFAQLYPNEFDGIVAGAPGFALPRAAIAEAWDVQSFGALVVSDGKPFDPSRLHETFSAMDLVIVRQAILDACDEADGLKDGIVADMYACVDAKVLPQLDRHKCPGSKTVDCLAADQISTLLRVIHGPQNRAGMPLYSDWFWPVGIAGEDWRIWKIGSSDGHIPALNIVLGGASLASVFTTPPTVLGGSPQAIATYQMRFDFDRDSAGIYSVAPPFTNSAWHDIGSRSSDLTEFQARGGKLIVPHGDSDPVFSLKDTLRWYDELNARSGGHASDFVRVFPVPGMCHCGGGQATDSYDAFSELVTWVERHKAPESLLATAGPRSPWPGRQRPVCAYPAVARYKGGDPEQASSFRCAA